MKHTVQFRELCWVAALLTLACGLAFAPDLYLPMLARAFLLQWSFFFAIVTLFLLIKKRWWPAWSALFGAVLILVQVPKPFVEAIPIGTGATLRILHMNVLQPNGEFDRAIQQSITSNADVISVQEVGPEWAEALTVGLREIYPYAHVEPRTNCYGIALFSKRPFVRVRTVLVQHSPFIEAVVDVEGTPVRLFAVHATSPISYAHFRKRNDQLGELAAYLAQSDTATVLVGDLNTVPWDRSFQRFCRDARMYSTTASEQRTWPSVGPLALIPLDHLLLSKGIVPASIRTVDISGSDHRGLVADVRIAPHES